MTRQTYFRNKNTKQIHAKYITVKCVFHCRSHLDSPLLSPVASPSPSPTASGYDFTILLGSSVQGLSLYQVHVSMLVTCAFCPSSEDHSDEDLEDSQECNSK